ncbi:MAG: ECF-type sigma factor [Gemmatimonadota bacterium]|nr:ECF-type sigma factor [Gemmatimonadota bacterium]
MATLRMMSHEAPTPPTLELIRAARDGDRSAVDELFALAYDELRSLAQLIRARGAGETLNTTALVHEAYLKLQPERGLDLQDKAHFTRIVARAMRQVLIDAARRRVAEKRGGGMTDVTLDEALGSATLRDQDLVQLDDALQELEGLDPRRASIVECRFFGGLTVEETAVALGVSAPTVKRDWRVARAWLARALGEG